MSQTGGEPQRIGIAVVEQDGRYLVGVRDASQTLAGKAEFPGGKCVSDETPRDAAVRECMEETGLSVESIELLYATEHTYSHASVAIEFWLCHSTDGNAQPSNGFRWFPRDELITLDFPEANRPMLELL